MDEVANTLAGSTEPSAPAANILQGRLATAQQRYLAQVRSAFASQDAAHGSNLWEDALRYSVDWTQRWILYWDTLRRRGNDFLEHERAGLPPVLHFDYEALMDGRKFERPVNYALLRIIPPAGVAVDSGKRPYVIIDPRAGHGPGISGFKDDSQVGVALRAGHPVYFVTFHPDPEPGQTLLDVCEAEAKFVQKVRELHAASPKPVIIGNCQGGWAAMMLAASNPEHTGPIVINGAPMSYWAGAWRDGEGDNPMRYAGGLLGGSWPASFASDLGGGKFDGAHLAQNFEALDPAHHLWEKYYHLFANADTETERFLDFERWWGGFFLLNREEIEWITQNLFVGNRLVSSELRSRSGRAFDLREIRSPMILFASLGDNITPPQQAFNWVADVYGSTEEIKARGQVIVGLLHQDIGHLGIFVSGQVVKKEHAQIVSVLESIEALPPGIYGMEIMQKPGQESPPAYQVQFVEYRLEEALERLNRYRRADEQPFEAVAAVSEFNQRAYDAYARPLVQAWVSEASAKMLREFHPLRLARWAISDLNPWLWWLAPAAAAVKNNRQPPDASASLRKTEAAAAQMVSASLDFWRDCRDALGEAAFFQLYGNPMATQRAAGGSGEQRPGRRWRDSKPRELPFVKRILETMAEGGYAEAVGRLAVLLRTAGEPLPLARVEARHSFAVQNLDLLPDVEFADLRRIEGSQEIIVRHAPQRALDTLPALVSEPADRERLVTLIEHAIAFRAGEERWLAEEQRSLLGRIRDTLSRPAPRIRPAQALPA